MVHGPPLRSEQRRDPRRPVTAIEGCQFDHSFREGLFIVPDLRQISLRRPRLTQHSTRPPLADLQTPDHMIDRLTFPLRAQKFGLAASRNIALSNSASARSRFSRAFSRSRSLNRLA